MENMKKPCKYCGAELPEGRNFCLACGKVQSAVPVTVRPPRRRLRLILPALILAALIACTPLLPLLQRQRPADPAEVADASQTDPGAPGRDGGEQEDGGGQTVAPDVHPPAYGVPADKENGEDTKNAGETASSVSAAPVYTAPAVSQPAPTPSPEPEPEPEPEPWWISNPKMEASEELNYWLANAPAIDPASFFTPGNTYTTQICADRDDPYDQIVDRRMLFFQPRYVNGEYLLYYGILHYHKAEGREDDGCDPAYYVTVPGFLPVDYHFTGECSVTARSVTCLNVPNYGRIMYLGGNVFIYESPESFLLNTVDGRPTEGLFSEDVNRFFSFFSGIYLESRPGALAAADYAVGLVT